MKPIIKYRGGKYREIKYFEEFIPEGFDTYIEPFVGGGAVFFYLEPRKSIAGKPTLPNGEPTHDSRMSSSPWTNRRVR